MQASNPMKARGSFSKPEELVKSMEQHETTRKPVTPPAEATSPAPEQKAAAVEIPEPTPEEKLAAAEKEREEKLLLFRKEIEKELGVVLADADMRDYLFKGRLSKEVELIPGLMKATFTTLRAEEYQAVEMRMAEIMDAGKLTSNGLENEKAIITLSHSWTHAGEPGKEVRPLGKDAAERENRIRKMGALAVEKAIQARTSFDTLVRLMMQERGVLKK